MPPVALPQRQLLILPTATATEGKKAGNSPFREIHMIPVTNCRAGIAGIGGIASSTFMRCLATDAVTLRCNDKCQKLKEIHMMPVTNCRAGIAGIGGIASSTFMRRFATDAVTLRRNDKFQKFKEIHMMPVRELQDLNCVNWWNRIQHAHAMMGRWQRATR